MTKEQEQAIERLTKTQNDILYATLYSQEEQDDDIKTVLNLIQQLQEENKQLKNILDERFIYVTGARTVYSRLMGLDKEIIVKDDLKLRNEIKQHISELEQKDKMIDEMIEEYEFNIRVNIEDFCDEEMRKNTCIQDCKNCIKQYFQKKVSNNVD